MPFSCERLHQAHHPRRPLSRAQGASGKPVASANGVRLDLIFDPVVVHGQLPVIDEAIKTVGAQALSN